MKRAFNKRLPGPLVNRVKVTAEKANVSQDLVVEAALRFFFDNTSSSQRPNIFFATLRNEKLTLASAEVAS